MNNNYKVHCILPCASLDHSIFCVGKCQLGFSSNRKKLFFHIIYVECCVKFTLEFIHMKNEKRTKCGLAYN